MKKTLYLPMLVVCFLVLMIGQTSAVKKEKAMEGKGPVVVSQAKFPISLQSGEYELQSVILDFAPGVGMSQHMHGGHVVVVVLSGSMILKEKGTERVIKTGGSWTENPGDLHAVMNAGKTKTRVAVSVLLPKGAEFTTMVK